MLRQAARRMKKRLRFLMIVDDVDIARFVHRNGVDRLFVDLEKLGKQERQKHVSSWKSHQSPADVTKIRHAVPDAHLLVRLNPLNPATEAEINDALERGADSLMLPMFRTYCEVAEFYDLVAGRANIVPLCETVGSLEAIPEMLKHLPVSELHIGLNDLHLDLGKKFMFQPLADGILEKPCILLREHGVAFGIGGVARAAEGIISPEYLLGEHVRLGSDGAILSRSFHRNAITLEQLQESTDFAGEIAKLQSIYADFSQTSAATLEHNREMTKAKVIDVVNVIKAGS